MLPTTHPRAIRPLPEAVINQIAAGEVIERPASVVKELVENALDAGAGSIDIEIDDGGIARIQIRDDGAGIPRDELTLALTRHCTSKITRAEDLPVLVTLGFRGEALAAIAAVADTVLTSRTAEAVHGWRIAQQPGLSAGVPTPQPHPRGTTVLVNELFARVPARRRFLKRAQTEALHVLNLVRRIAFCTPGVAFQLSVDGARSLQLPAARDARSAERRQRALFGAEFAAGARYVDTVFDDIRVAGWIAGPELAHAQADLQMLAVNGRIVRDRHLLHALRMAYEDRLPGGRHACFALQIEMPPEAVDVNVHPGKLEVRFRDLRAVHDVVHAAARQALAAQTPTQYATPGASVRAAAGEAPVALHDAPRTVLSAAPPERASAARAAPRMSARRVLAVVDARHAICEDDSGCCVIDLGALVERALARRLAAGYAVKPLLIPLRLECPDAACVARLAARLAADGLDTSALGERVLALRALPVALPDIDAQRFGPAFLAQLTAAPAASLAQICASATAAALRVPPLASCDEWLARLWAQAEEAGVDPIDCVRRLDASACAALFSRRD